ncbi:MotE family protein [Magnetococcales bacterium HHB-1]
MVGMITYRKGPVFFWGVVCLFSLFTCSGDVFGGNDLLSVNPMKDPLKLLDSLEERRKNLNQQKDALEKRYEGLKKLGSTVKNDKIKKLTKWRLDVCKGYQREAKIDQKNIDQLAGIYSRMKPKKAAEQLSNIRRDTAIRILKAMRSRVMARILNKMNQKLAVRLADDVARSNPKSRTQLPCSVPENDAVDTDIDGEALADVPFIQEPLELLRALEARRKVLDQRRLLLDKKELELDRLHREVERRIKALNNLYAEMEKDYKDETDVIANANVQRLSNIYTRMKPKKAAEQLSKLKMEMAVAALKVMRERVAARILNKMVKNQAVLYANEIGLSMEDKRRRRNNVSISVYPGPKPRPYPPHN